MAVKIRLKRMGSKKSPFYRMVVADVRAPRDGRYIEEIGYYNPLTKDMKLDNEKALDWIAKGAQPTETARALLKQNGAWGEVAPKAPKKKGKKKEEAATPVVEETVETATQEETPAEAEAAVQEEAPVEAETVAQEEAPVVEEAEKTEEAAAE